MTLTELIRTRRTVGGFTNQPIDHALLDELLESAVYTPNHKMTQPWRFIVFEGAACERYAAIRRAIAGEIGKDPQKEYQKYLSVPLYLFVVMKESSHAHTRTEDYAATAALVQNFLLLAWEQGIGTAWKTYPADQRLNNLLGLAADESVVGVIHTGYPVGEGKVPMRKSAQLVTMYVS